PEQARKSSVDHRADLFSLGCVLYRLCAGRLPWQGEDAVATLIAMATEEPLPLLELNPHLPPKLAALVMQLLAKHPEQRPASAQRVAEMLREIGAELAKQPGAPASRSAANDSNGVTKPAFRPAPALKRRLQPSFRSPRLLTIGATVGIIALALVA